MKLLRRRSRTALSFFLVIIFYCAAARADNPGMEGEVAGQVCDQMPDGRQVCKPIRRIMEPATKFGKKQSDVIGQSCAYSDGVEVCRPLFKDSESSKGKEKTLNTQSAPAGVPVGVSCDAMGQGLSDCKLIRRKVEPASNYGKKESDVIGQSCSISMGPHAGDEQENCRPMFKDEDSSGQDTSEPEEGESDNKTEDVAPRKSNRSPSGAWNGKSQLD